jgi:hypothetical protein
VYSCRLFISVLLLLHSGRLDSLGKSVKISQ